MLPNPRLPQELLDLVVDLLPDSRDDLASLCLTSRSFYDAARRNLFRSFTITTPLKSFISFAGFLLHLSPHHRRYIKHLTLSQFGIEAGQRHTPVEAVTASLVAYLLILLPNLRTLTFRRVTLASETATDPWGGLPGPRNLHEVSFVNVRGHYSDGFKGYLQILSLFGAVDTLRFGDRAASWFTSASPLDLLEESYFPRALAVRHLCIDDQQESAWLSILYHTRTMQNTPPLRALDLLFMYPSDSMSKLDHVFKAAGDQLTHLRYHIWPVFTRGWRDEGPYSYAPQLLRILRHCPRLRDFTIGVPLWCSLPYTEPLFECIAALLNGLPKSVQTFILVLDFECHPTPAVSHAESKMVPEWTRFRVAVERTGLDRLHLVWRYLENGQAVSRGNFEKALSNLDTAVSAILQSDHFILDSTLQAY